MKATDEESEEQLESEGRQTKNNTDTSFVDINNQVLS